jgi:hypothetical protein
LSLACVNANNLSLSLASIPFNRINFTGFLINDSYITDGTISWSKLKNILFDNLTYFVDNWLPGSKISDLSISNGKIISVDYSKLTNITYDINNFADNSITNIK